MKHPILKYVDESDITLNDSICWTTSTDHKATGIVGKDEYDNWCIKSVTIDGKNTNGSPWHILHIKNALKNER